MRTYQGLVMTLIVIGFDAFGAARALPRTSGPAVCRPPQAGGCHDTYYACLRDASDASTEYLDLAREEHDECTRNAQGESEQNACDQRWIEMQNNASAIYRIGAQQCWDSLNSCLRGAGCPVNPPQFPENPATEPATPEEEGRGIY